MNKHLRTTTPAALGAGTYASLQLAAPRTSLVGIMLRAGVGSLRGLKLRAAFSLGLLLAVGCHAETRTTTPSDTSGAAGKANSGGALQGADCLHESCAAGLECVRFYGFAGPSGPEFASCEIRCDRANPKCPEAQTCTLIADGPGEVCRKS